MIRTMVASSPPASSDLSADGGLAFGVDGHRVLDEARRGAVAEGRPDGHPLADLQGHGHQLRVKPSWPGAKVGAASPAFTVLAWASGA